MAKAGVAGTASAAATIAPVINFFLIVHLHVSESLVGADITLSKAR